jgi:hypothetical protein
MVTARSEQALRSRHHRSSARRPTHVPSGGVRAVSSPRRLAVTGNIRAMAEADAAGEILFLHACTPYESARTPTPRTVSGEAYDITALVSERGAPQHVQMVWHGVNDEWNLRQFLTSRVTWGECDLRVDPLGRLVLRHDSFEDTPWCAEERLLRPRAGGCVRRARPGTQARWNSSSGRLTPLAGWWIDPVNAQSSGVVNTPNPTTTTKQVRK